MTKEKDVNFEFSRTMKMLAQLNRDLTVDRSLKGLIRSLI